MSNKWSRTVSLSPSLTASQTDIVLEDARENGFALSLDDVRNIFQAKCDDFNIRATDKLFTRFERQLLDKPFLKVFQMESTSIGPLASASIRNILTVHPNFKVIQLAGNSIGNKGAIEFAQLILNTSSIVSIDLSSNGIEDKGMAAIFNAMRRNKTIISLNLGSRPGMTRNSIGNEAAAALSQMLANNLVLSELDLSMVEITVENVGTIASGLSKNTTLCELNLSNNNIQSRGVAQILPCLVSSRVSALRLSGNHLKDDCGTYFANFFKQNKNVNTIDISNNGLTARFIATIAPTITKCEAIKEFNLSKNPLTGRSAEIFSKIISANSTLKSLILQACKIDLTGIKEFALGLAQNRGLQVLNLSNNSLRDDGLDSLSRAFVSQRGLEQLFLDLTEMGDKSCDSIFTALSKSETIKSISIKNNLVKDGAPILQFIQNNSKCRKLSIEYNDISYAYIQQISKAVSQNKHRWQQQNESKTTSGTRSLEELENELNDCREMIKAQRDDIISLNTSLENAQKEQIETRKNQIHNLSTLEIVDRGASKTLRNLLDENRNYLDKMDHELNVAKQEFNVIASDLDNERERFNADMSGIASLGRQIEANQEKYEKELHELDVQIRDKILEYKAACVLLENAFKDAKNPKPKAGGESQESPGKGAGSKKSRKKSTAAKSKSEDPENKEGEEEQPKSAEEQEAAPPAEEGQKSVKSKKSKKSKKK
ncbi:Leucine Rich Repeat family protein [Trichomonas vaginalis G3]|uniref:Leucine Rich Repeat family protein n=1 Tax=Trichomonas vaginalis (strain ATCC PRA-98 / G3) TaxID=412133 RepID=A2DAA3_TRIV3|nr:uncharacterized protein TVAGG3_0266840 [Trichomonas vaginalis G3]EAY22751.1 Leucine Rich Repeat family protein [Trichomonas vaginalis G3]KAI5525562.1 interleukin-8 biosynthetic process [Trichomonas vaginalis G3]|eukprot:XP_001583737.1 hypothetical protein [Trichomonas vaginalis G3]